VTTAPAAPAPPGAYQGAPAPVVVAPQAVPQQIPAPEHHHDDQTQEVRIYSHSTFLYWWPVWLTGYIMALVTRIDGIQVQIGDSMVWFHRSKNLGVLFTLMFFLVILITNVTLRGLASVVAILAVAFGALLLAYYGLWEDVLNWMGKVSIYMNMGFYVFFSTLVLSVWAFSVFVYDRLSYWRVTPGQLTYDAVIGGAQKSYDTRGMVFEKHRQDLFRHWVLGLGSGDIQISTTGARRETLNIPNVLFVDSKVGEIQKMIAMQPDQFQGPGA
jgi:amino acid transporter